MLFRQTCRQFSHAGTSENNHLGLVLSLREFDFRTDLRGRIRRGIIE